MYSFALNENDVIVKPTSNDDEKRYFLKVDVELISRYILQA